MAASLKLSVCPLVQVWFWVGAVTTGGAAGVNTENVSDAESPLVSVAVTLMARPAALPGTVPVNVSVMLLKWSQLGSAAPFASVAV